VVRLRMQLLSSEIMLKKKRKKSKALLMGTPSCFSQSSGSQRGDHRIVWTTFPLGERIM